MDLTFIQVCSHHNRFVWEVEVMLENYIKVGYTYDIHNIVFIPVDEEENKNFRLLENKYKDYSFIKFFFYKGDQQLKDDTTNTNYIPLLRPYCLEKHFELHPELSSQTIFYHDSDILWTRKLDFSPFLNDNICYQSYAGHYLNYDYLSRKVEEAIPERVHDLRMLNPIENIVKQFDISVDTLRENNTTTGGAQSLLKNIDSKFWKDVYIGCIKIKSFFSILNQGFFKGDTNHERESNGWQSWALGDMCSLSWNLWKRNMVTKCPKELDFAWATDKISRLKDVYILHNAGVAADIIQEKNSEGIITKEYTLFYKGRPFYVNGTSSPHKEYDLLCTVSNEYCSWFYVNNLINIKNPIF